MQSLDFIKKDAGSRISVKVEDGKLRIRLNSLYIFQVDEENNIKEM